MPSRLSRHTGSSPARGCCAPAAASRQSVPQTLPRQLHAAVVASGLAALVAALAGCGGGSGALAPGAEHAAGPHAAHDRSSDSAVREPWDGGTVDLATALNDVDSSVRIRAIEAVSDHGPPDDQMRYATLIETALADRDPAVRLEAIDALVEQPEVGRPLVWLSGALLDPEPAVREAAVEALAGIRGHEAVHALGAALIDSDVGVREAAVFALGAIGGVEARHLLTQALADPDEAVSEAAGELLDR